MTGDRLTVDRREALRALGILAGGGLLAACGAGAPEPAVGPGATSTPITPPPRLGIVRASRDRVIRTVVGLRPYRDAGFVVRAELLDDKPIIHNYGHGGGGVTLSWGTAQLALEEAARTGHRECAVIGCGAVGLATARLLQRAGWKVRIYARDLPPRTTSNIAGGQWFPSSVFAPESATTEFRASFARASRSAFRSFQDLVGDHYGVRWLDNYFVGQTRIGPGFLGGLDDLYPNVARLGPGEHPFPRPYALRFTTMLVEPPAYLAAMERDARLAGAEIRVREFHEPQELVELPEPVVINCTGLGSRDLFGDEELVPVKGQLTFVLPQPEVDYVVGFDAGYYMMPRDDGILLGGTWERGVWSLEPNREAEARIVGAHQAFFSAMAAAKNAAGAA